MKPAGMQQTILPLLLEVSHAVLSCRVLPLLPTRCGNRPTTA